VTGHSAVSSLSLEDTIRVGADRGHKAKGTEALSDDIGLNITIVVLAGPHKVTVRLNSLSNQIVDKTMFIVKTDLLEF